MRSSLVVAIGCLAACHGAADDDGASAGAGGLRRRPPAAAPTPPDAAPPIDPDAGAEAADLAGGGGGGGGVPGSGGTISPSDPSTVMCDDPVAGVWIAKTFADRSARWHEHRLAITEVAPDEYRAHQTTRMWNGSADDRFPLKCPDGTSGGDVVEMSADLEWREDRLRVWGTSVERALGGCGLGAPTYNLDSFTGRLRRNTFEAVNNDGRDAVNRPYRFRRIACAP